MKSMITILFLLPVVTSFAQADKVVQWKAHYDAPAKAIVLTAEMGENWVIYSQHTDPDGPIPLAFEFDKTEGIKFIGDVKEVHEPIEVMSEMFGVTVRKFKEKAEFRQEIEGYQAGKSVSGNITFMTCDDKKCLPPETISFEVKL